MDGEEERREGGERGGEEKSTIIIIIIIDIIDLVKDNEDKQTIISFTLLTPLNLQRLCRSNSLRLLATVVQQTPSRSYTLDG